MKKFFKYFLLTIPVLILSGVTYEQVSRFYLDKKYPPKSEFVEIDGRKIHFKKVGNKPVTVVFESGLGGDYLHWQEIQKEVSKNHTTISYDKAGILWSDSTDEISLERYADDLFQLLEKTNCPKPYILVGHSFGGITLRSFIKNHSPDIAGIVFVDAAHPLQLQKCSEKLKSSFAPPSKEILNFLTETGAVRLLYTLTPFTQSVPQNHWFNQNVKDYFYKISPGLFQEMENDKKLMAEAQKINDFGSIPLVVISAKYPDGVENVTDKDLEKEYLQVHKSVQTDLLNLSTNSKQIIAEKSGHYITLQQPDLIINTIENIKIATR
ncbi:MAG: alpha/beta hydrolase [Flavobacterium sp.]|nr:MAG: alpha/beta hydrolase [Flavobacterium sp.]